MQAGAELKVFTTCPVSTLDKPRACVRRIENVARWSEEAGCEGILVFSDHWQLDPWLVSRAIISATDKLTPLVTIQPAYAHPYAVAKSVASLGFMYGRRIYLNMVAGELATDVQALADSTPPEQRYLRLVEYAKLVRSVLQADKPISFEGAFYRTANLRMVPTLSEDLQPEFFVSGAEEASRAAAAEISATSIESLPALAGAWPDRARARRSYGVRLGVITDRDEARAWSIARDRFPEERKMQISRPFARVADSRWRPQLVDSAEQRGLTGSYWLAPLRNHQAPCPYLVGSYDQVAAEIAAYVEDGCTTFVLEEPASEEDMQHTGFAFGLVTQHYAAA